jgi:invasion protein IalB
MRLYTKLITIFLLASSANAFGIVESKLIGEYGSGKAWMARIQENGDQKICFISSNPISTTLASDKKRDTPALMITNWYNEGILNELSVQAGFPLKLGSTVTMITGDSSYKLFTSGEGAYIEDLKIEKDVIKKLKKGARVKVKSISTKNTKVTDTYSLIGFTKALEAINKACS